MAKINPPAPPERDFDQEKIALQIILDALLPFHPEIQATLIRTVVVFKGIYIPSS